MALTTRLAGRPSIVTGAISGAPSVQEGKIIDGQTPTTWISIENEDSNSPIKVYFTEADFNADANFIRVKPSSVRDLPVELYGTRELFFRCENVDPTATAAYVVLFAQRAV